MPVLIPFLMVSFVLVFISVDRTEKKEQKQHIEKCVPHKKCDEHKHKDHEADPNL